MNPVNTNNIPLSESEIAQKKREFSNTSDAVQQSNTDTMNPMSYFNTPDGSYNVSSAPNTNPTENSNGSWMSDLTSVLTPETTNAAEITRPDPQNVQQIPSMPVFTPDSTSVPATTTSRPQNATQMPSMPSMPVFTPDSTSVPPTTTTDTTSDSPNDSWMPSIPAFTPETVSAPQSTPTTETPNDSWMPSMPAFTPVSPATETTQKLEQVPLMSPFSPASDAAPEANQPETESKNSWLSSLTSTLSPEADGVTKKNNYVSGIVSSMQWGFDFVSIVKYFFILILLALMGINVFSYLGDAGIGASGILGKFIDLLSGVASGVKSGIKVVVTQTMKTSVGGIKANV